MTKHASLNQCEKLVAEGKRIHPVLASKIRETVARLEAKLERWKKIQNYIKE